MPETNEIDKEKLVKFFARSLNLLPSPYTNALSTHSSLIYFVISGLDLLGRFDIIEKERKQIIDWIYSLQILPNKNDPEANIQHCGFRGGLYIGIPFFECPNHSEHKYQDNTPLDYDIPNLANTYCSLLILRILGDDFSGVNKKAIISSLKTLQQPDGSFVGTPCLVDNDMRYLFCACAISFMLDDWSGLNKDLAVDYIVSSQTYEYGFGQGPCLEAHGGYTYCALAALALMGNLNKVPNYDKLLYWLSSRQITGFNGRTNKDVDTCYSFWVGSSIDILNQYHTIVDEKLVKSFTVSAQHTAIGGIAKEPDHTPDILHSYLSLSGLSIIGDKDILPLNPVLGISKRAAGDDWNNKLLNQLK